MHSFLLINLRFTPKPCHTVQISDNGRKLGALNVLGSYLSFYITTVH